MVEVTQSARIDAAEIVRKQMKGSMDWFYANDHHDRIISGNWDNHPLVQAFAAAEQRGAERQRERDAKVAENHLYGDGLLDSCTLREGHRKDIAQAIRQEPTT